MHRLLTLVLRLSGLSGFSQIKGRITSADGQPIPFVGVAIENTYTGTNANENGEYELNIKTPGKYTLLFQSIGYKTERVTVNAATLPYVQNITLSDESYQLNEVVVSSGENPANGIMRNAIAAKKENSAKTGRFEADFYSKGIIRLKDVPDKIMGINVKEEMENELDSTGSGIIYLSETVSRITFEQPNKLKERVVASKISGDDNGFSYNTALGTFYNFYDNYVPFAVNMISPLADNAFNYYRFTFEGSYYDENETLINKIKLTPKRDKEPVFEGYIYIVENSWAISAIDVDIKGYRIQQPILENLNLKQNFSFNANNHIWAKNSQIFDFKAGMFGVGVTGTFTHIYTNYNFKDSFDKGTFGKEIVFVEEDSNKKDSLYWNAMRPVPLTEEEVADYTKKDSIQELERSPAYLDSIDRKHNKFKVADVLTGYSYRNSKNKTTYSYDGVLGLNKIGFNTVQGWNFDTGLSFRKYDEETGKSTYIGAEFNYGVAEDRLRVIGRFTKRFSKKNNGTLFVWGGTAAQQFNSAEPIKELVNSMSTLFFKDNYMKLYDNAFAKAQYQQDVFTGLFMAGSLEDSRSHALLNNTDYVLIARDKEYTSNDPLDPANTTPAFERHHLMKANIFANIRFGEKYITRPDGKIPVRSGRFPTLSLQFQKAFAASESHYEYSFAGARVAYSKTLGNKGDFGINLKGGKFFDADGISFVDYKHFNGNQTHIYNGFQNLDSFNLLPYYTHSTNDRYFEMHAEHNFKGYIMNKLPLLNKLQWNLVVGYHAVATPDYKPYQEFTAGFDNIGFGKFRMLRVDYVRSYQGSAFRTDGIMFGIKFLDILDR